MRWKSLIADLLEIGMSQKEIADAVGCSQPTICDLANGKQEDTRASIGLALIDLHREKLPEKAA